MPYNFIQKEHEIQDFWKKEQIFKKSLEKNKNNKPYVFYDGPPFATGSPHYGHILAGTIKDTICRHAQLNGYYVERRAGFDCHGLPVDHIVDKKLGLKNYQQIIEYGIKKYNDECRGVVLRCVDEWISTTERLGRWIDFENGYKTMDTDYMESDWAVFKILWDKKLIYKGLKVMSYSTALGTPLSNFEAKSNYKEVMEESIIVKFRDKTTNWYYLVWTTTPWTLSSNMALCVNANIDYNVVRYLDEYYVVAKDLVKSVFGAGKKQKLPDGLNVTMTFKGKDLIGNEYEPIMKYYKTDTDYQYNIIADDFVEDGSGTGIVHIAPAFGEADLNVCIKNNIVTKSGAGIRCPVDKNGCYTDVIFDYTGKNVKECDRSITRSLKESNKLFKRFNHKHDIAFCWRSDTPLIYKAVDSWFIDINKIKSQLLVNNLKTNWTPEYIRDKRFHNWLEDARDWGFSRTRVWGTPIPIYTNTEGTEYYCVSSISELEKLTGLEPGSITDLHRDNIDNLTITSPNTGNKLHRIDDVFDCWFESGAMPFSHQHYPFEKKFNFPADFIAEGVDQTRGWFYTLLVLSTIVMNEPAFKNVIVNGLVLANDGKKMSKRLKNYPDPINIIDQYGADSLRLYLLCSPVVKAETLSFDGNGVRDISKSVLIPFENSYSFYYEQKIKYESKYNKKLKITAFESNNIYDKWIIHKMTMFKNKLFDDLNNYKLFNCKKIIMSFVEELNNQYIKLNKFRLKGHTNQQSYKSFINTLGLCLYNLSITLSSLTPFFSEYLFQKLKDDLDESVLDNSRNMSNSVHLLGYDNLQLPEFDNIMQFEYVDQLHQIIDLVRIVRARDNIPFKMPVADILICSNNPALEQQLAFVLDHLKTESNILNVKFDDINKYSQKMITCNKGAIGKQFKKLAKDICKEVAKLSNNHILENIDNLQVCGVTLNQSHFNIQRNISDIPNYCYESSNDFIVFLNQTKNREIILQYYSKLLSTTIQKYRKELELKPWDKIIVNYVTQSDDFQEAFSVHKQTINNNINNPVHMNNELNNNVIGEKEVTLENKKLKLQIMKSE